MQPTAKAAHDLHTPRLSRPVFPSHLRITMNGMGFGEQGQQSSQARHGSPWESLVFDERMALVENSVSFHLGPSILPNRHL